MTNLWTEANSETFRALASVAVPQRAEQMAALLALLPFERDAHFRAVELASGEGRLAAALLSAFPNATLLALDGSEVMRQDTAQRLARFGERAQVGGFDMAASDWYPQLEGANAVLSSLCVHHLDGAGKQALFAAVNQHMANGAFLIADLVLPTRPQTRDWFADSYDEVVKRQAGNTGLYQRFVSEEWNFFRYPDDEDQPSPLFDQLIWLQGAGFASVDCFWMQAGHAVYGGYKGVESSGGVGYQQALDAVQVAFRD